MALAGAASATPLYTVNTIGTLGGSYSSVNGMNNNGQVVGQTTTSGETHAFLYSNGSMSDLGTLGGADNYIQWSTALGINDNGQVVGDSTYMVGNQYKQHAFLYSNGSMSDLGTLGESFSVPGSMSVIDAYSLATGINNNGQVVGHSGIAVKGLQANPVPQSEIQIFGVSAAAHGWSRAFLYSNGSMSDLGTLGGSFSAAYGINNNGQVVGQSTTAGDQWTQQAHAFLYSNGSMSDLGTLGGSYSVAVGINNNGQVVGSSKVATGGTHAFLYSNGSMSDLGTLGGWASYARDINNNGQVVGFYFLGGLARAFLYSNGSMSDLNSLIDPTSDWTIQYASSVNDSGDILAYGCSNSGAGCQYLLLDSIDLSSSTVPEPDTLALTSLALLSSVGVRRRVKNRAVGVVQTQVTL